MPPAVYVDIEQAPAPRPYGARFALITALAFLAIAAWDLSGLDLPVARVVAGSSGFPLRDSPLLETVLHDAMRDIGWIFLALLLLGAIFPRGVLRSLSTTERLQIPLSILLGVVAVTLMKFWSKTSCPWDLHEFGGSLPYVSHWNLAEVDGGAGRCFPSGHACAGFAFLGAYFALRRHRRGWATLCLLLAMAAGLVLGVSQQLRGAHFMSHTLWTAWVCWTVAGVADAVVHWRAAGRAEMHAPGAQRDSAV